jgi:hypothetical protein
MNQRRAFDIPVGKGIMVLSKMSIGGRRHEKGSASFHCSLSDAVAGHKHLRLYAIRTGSQ